MSRNRLNRKMFDTVIDIESKLAEVALTSADNMATDLVDKINAL